MEANSISKRIKKLREEKGITLRAIAAELDVPFGTYAGYEYYLNRKIPTIVIQKLAQIFGTTVEYIKNGTGNSDSQKNTIVIYVNQGDQSERIAYVPIAAQAGYLKHYINENFMQKLATYSLPGFINGTYRMFPVQGDSMLPTYSPYDILICEYVESYEKIKDGECYVIVSTEGICVKRCINAVIKRGAIIIESDNSEYKPDLIPIDSIIEIWYPKARITKH